MTAPRSETCCRRTVTGSRSSPARRGAAFAAAAFRADVVVADAKLPGLDGLGLVRSLGALARPPRLILLCARASCQLDGLGVPCLPKPIDLELLRSHLAAPRAGWRAGARRQPSAA